MPPPVPVEIRGGGSLNETLTSHHSVIVFPDLEEGLTGPGMNGGGSIQAVANKGDYIVQDTMNGGGSFHVITDAPFHATAVMSGGGSLTVEWENTSPKLVAVTMNGGGSIFGFVGYPARLASRHTVATVGTSTDTTRGQGTQG